LALERLTASRKTTRALLEFAGVLHKLREKGYSMNDLGQDLGMSAQAIHDLLKRAER